MSGSDDAPPHQAAGRATRDRAAFELPEGLRAGSVLLTLVSSGTFLRPVSSMLLRAYSPADHQACLLVFESNVPDFFLESERADFRAFLDELPGPYFVVEDDAGEIVACGGFAVVPETRHADLCWGMVRRDLHRRGIGDRLLRERLARIASRADVDAVRLDTTQFTHAYYERVGFRVQRVTPDGYGPGMHRYDMLLGVGNPLEGRPSA